MTSGNEWPETRNGMLDTIRVILVAVGYGTLALVAVAVAVPKPGYRIVFWILVAALMFLVVAAIAARIRLRDFLGAKLRPLADVLVLGLLVLWALLYNAWGPGCTEAPLTDAPTQSGMVLCYRALAEPELRGLRGLHALSVLAFAVSRRHRAALHGPAELFVHAFLIVGIVVHALVAVQIRELALLGMGVPPLLPLATPLFTILFYGEELVVRLRRRGAEAASTPHLVACAAPVGSTPAEAPDDGGGRAHRLALLKALALSPVLLGAWTVAQKALLGWGPLQVFTRTCGHTFSTLPRLDVHSVYSLHYLCTVAAQGHASLVRPERVGRRRGVAILVNRQLAVANAFEDLLHERWPRFGGAARQLYDRLGLPVSKWIRGKWMADAVYLLMKPAEWLFYLTLVLLDPGAPERRIDRMYR